MSAPASLLLTILLASGLCSVADKGYCPPAPPARSLQGAPAAPKQAPAPNLMFAGTVTLQAVLSDKGYVCNLQVMQTFDKEAADSAIKSVKDWKFDPAKKNGDAVPVVAVVEVYFWRTPDGRLVQTPNGPEKQSQK